MQAYLIYENLCCSLPTGLHVGRTNIKQVAEKRRIEIERFLHSLFLMADELSHSDLVYTFFHPILRDQQESNIHARKVKGVYCISLPFKLNQPFSISESRQRDSGAEGCITGQLKLSIQYRRDVLLVMVHHARGLPTVGNQEPSTYVKVYLTPDKPKLTKRKTKVVRRSCHPSFMEMVKFPPQSFFLK